MIENLISWKHNRKESVLLVAHSVWILLFSTNMYFAYKMLGGVMTTVISVNEISIQFIILH